MMPELEHLCTKVLILEVGAHYAFCIGFRVPREEDACFAVLYAEHNAPVIHPLRIIVNPFKRGQDAYGNVFVAEVQRSRGVNSFGPHMSPLQRFQHVEIGFRGVYPEDRTCRFRRR